MTETRKLGKNGPELTTVGYGAWAIGGPWFFGWGPQDDQESMATIRRSLDLGINWIDTAPVYGSGHSEEVVGQAIRGLSRDDLFLATKCGRVSVEGKPPQADLRPQSIRNEMEASLRRLGTEYMDLYQIHWPDNETGTPIEDSWATLAALQDEGKTRFIGVSNFNIALLERCEKVRHVNSLQPPYSLARREVEAEILPYCEKNGIGVIAYSPMQCGLLTGKFDLSRLAPDDWRRRDPYFQEPRLSSYLSLVDALRPLADRHGKTVGQLAIAWVLAQPAITAAIVGARRLWQAEENTGAMGFQLTSGELEEIEKAYQSLHIG